MHLFRKSLLFIFLAFTVTRPVLAQNTPAEMWADSLMKTMTVREKIGQLVMMAVYSNRDIQYEKNVSDTILRFQPGSIVFFQGTPQKEIQLMNRWQSDAKIPMLVAMDAEWGPAMRLDSMIAFPRLMTLAAACDTSLIFAYGKAIGQQCKRLGIHINFAPVVDVNNNPLNPVINYRSFGENQHKVALYADCFCRGMESEGILSVAKHFPGHGNTSQDSHRTLPDVTDNADIIDSVHLFPFAEMAARNVWGIMVAHVFIPALDNTPNLPSSLSKKIITDILKEKMDYDGLIITDALMMKGVTKYHKPGAIEVKALMARNDILLMPANLPLALDSVENAIGSGRISMGQIDKTVRKILITKYTIGLSKWAPVDETGVTRDLNQKKYFSLSQTIFDKSVTLIQCSDGLLPLESAHKKIAVVSLRSSENGAFHTELEKYAQFDSYFIGDPEGNSSEINNIIEKTTSCDVVVVAVHDMSFWTRNNYGFTEKAMDIVNQINQKTKTILCLFGNPYSFRTWPYSSTPEAIVVTYERGDMAEISAARAIFGAIPFGGHLPVSISETYRAGTGIQVSATNRLIETDPMELNINQIKLDSIGIIVEKAILDSVFPGCQILAAVNGKIFYNESFGYHTYDKTIPVEATDLYDLASVTKMLATTLAVMKLYDEGKIDLQQELQAYLPKTAGTNVGKIHLDRLLTHSSGLPAWIPFHLATLKNGKRDTALFRTQPDSLFSVRVCDNLFVRNDFPDSMTGKIMNSKLKPDQGYKYSDLGFILLCEMVVQITGEPFDRYLNENFYQPLGLNRFMFNPTDKFPLSEIPPTEDDKTFRERVIHGYVHDQAAALFGGVSGHAGLFGNTYDAAVIMQMLLQKGNYAGVQYYKASTIQRFTSTYFDKNRRGLGFDKPSGFKNGNVCSEASPKSFGHSGFTGTYVWADPQNGLVFVFLSNRVYPDAENWKITKTNIRTKIHSLIYQALQTN